MLSSKAMWQKSKNVKSAPFYTLYSIYSIQGQFMVIADV